MYMYTNAAMLLMKRRPKSQLSRRKYARTPITRKRDLRALGCQREPLPSVRVKAVILAVVIGNPPSNLARGRGGFPLLLATVKRRLSPSHNLKWKV